VELTNLSRPEDAFKVIGRKGNKERTDGSKCWHRVGSGVAVFGGNELAAQLKFMLNKKCSNNQAEQLAIVKALQTTETLNITEN